MGKTLEERTIIAPGSRSRWLAATQSLGVLIVTCTAAIMADAPMYLVVMVPALCVVAAVPRSLHVTARSAVYTVTAPMVLAFFLNLAYPIDPDRFFFPSVEHLVPFLLVLCVTLLFLAQHPTTIAASMAAQCMVLFVLGSALSLPMFERFEGLPRVFRERFMVFGVAASALTVVIVPLLVSSLRLRRPARLEVQAARSRLRWRSTALASIIILCLIGGFSANAVSSTLDPFFRDVFRRYMEMVHSQVLFVGNIDLNRKLHPYVQNNKGKIVVRAFSQQEPGYLRGFVYEVYEGGRWAGAGATRKLSAEEDETLASRRFFHEPTRSAETIPPDHIVQIHPTNGLDLNQLIMPGGSYGVELIAATMQSNRNDEFIPGEIDLAGGYTAYSAPADRFTLPAPHLDLNELPADYLYVPDYLQDYLRPHLPEWEPATSTSARIASSIAFLQRRCEYALKRQPESDDDPIVVFLEQSQEGHCELFATSVVMMLRMQNVPTRYVSGFVCREPHPLEEGWIARLIDCHAWAEAYDAESGRWLLVEATPLAGVPDGKSEAGLFAKIREATIGVWVDLFSKIKRGYFAEAVLSGLARLWEWLRFLLWTGPWFIGWPIVIALLWLGGKKIHGRRIRRIAAGQASQAFRELERALVPYAGTRDGCLTARAYAELAIVGMAPHPQRLRELITAWERIRYGGAPLADWPVQAQDYVRDALNPADS